MIGEIAGAYGVRGQVRIHNYSEAPVELLEADIWYLLQDDKWCPYRVESARLHGQTVLGKLEGITDRDVAAALRNTKVALRREDLPPPEENEFYWADLNGMKVVNREGQTIGTVSGLLRTPANDVLRVKTSEEGEMLIPFIQSVIDKVDNEARTVYVDWGVDWV